MTTRHVPAKRSRPQEHRANSIETAGAEPVHTLRQKAERQGNGRLGESQCGRETPQLFRPLGNATVITAGLACSPCVNVGNQRRSLCADNQCMKRIPVLQVFAPVRVALESPAEPESAANVTGVREAVEA